MPEEKTKKMCGVEIEFPVMCHVKVITEKRDGMQDVIEAVLSELELSVKVTSGSSSAGGKYLTYNFSFMADSKKDMTKVDMEMREIDGVKMVM